MVALGPVPRSRPGSWAIPHDARRGLCATCEPVPPIRTFGTAPPSAAACGKKLRTRWRPNATPGHLRDAVRAVESVIRQAHERPATALPTLARQSLRQISTKDLTNNVKNNRFTPSRKNNLPVLAHGSTSSQPAPTTIWLWLPWPTNWLALHGSTGQGRGLSASAVGSN